MVATTNKETANKYIKNASMHISSINSILKSIKSSIIADFIQANDRGVIIFINNVVLSSDLQEVKKIVKSLLQDDKD